TRRRSAPSTSTRILWWKARSPASRVSILFSTPASSTCAALQATTSSSRTERGLPWLSLFVSGPVFRGQVFEDSIMKNAQPGTIYLRDYQAPAFLIDETNLRFELGEHSTLVISRLTMRRNPLWNDHAPGPLVLAGQDMLLEKLLLDGRALLADEYLIGAETLTISALPEAVILNGAAFVLECHTRIKPQENTSLEGLYKSKKMFCTQCEAEGFRKITYY